MLFNSSTRMPCAFSRSADFTELDTVPLIRCLIFASSSMKRLAVEPEPMPIHASSTTYLIAARATACFCSSWVIVVMVADRGRASKHHPAHVGEQHAEIRVEARRRRAIDYAVVPRQRQRQDQPRHERRAVPHRPRGRAAD